MTIRQVDIRAPTPRAELLSVVRSSTLVCLGVWLYLVGHGAADDGPTRGPRKNLLPFQSVVQDRSIDEQRMFRELQVGLIESQNIRSTSGAWPDVSALARDGIEPFAPDPTRKGAGHAWRMQRDGYYVSYRGVPVGRDAPGWLLLILEPNPDLPAEPFQNDEEHARLLDGTVIHVSIWVHPAGAPSPQKPLLVPQNDGWTQLFAAGPSPTH